MVIYAILMFVAGAFNQNKAKKIEKEMDTEEMKKEENKEIRAALAKSAQKRRRTANVLFIFGGVFIVIFLVLMATI